MDDDSNKRQAADAALQYVKSGMVLGLGTGSTANFMVQLLAERLRDGRLHNIVGVPSSEVTAALARQYDIPLTSLDTHPQLDLALDGADEIDPALNLIKGLGGALLREKIIATSAAQFIVMGSATKLVGILGEHTPLPVEVVKFGVPLCERRLAELGATPLLRRTTQGNPFLTDEGHYILDCRFTSIPDPASLGTAIKCIPGVVEHGLFIAMATIGIVAGPAGVATIVRPI